MAFPNHIQIESKALELGADPIRVFAFAAVHARLPRDNADLSSIDLLAQSRVWGVTGDDITFRYGYIQAHGGAPDQGHFYVQWLQNKGFARVENANVIELGRRPFPGEDYPPGGAPINPPATSGITPETPPAPVSSFDFGSLLRPPTVYLVGGLGVLLLLRRR